jgi:uncharacterized protein
MREDLIPKHSPGLGEDENRAFKIELASRTRYQPGAQTTSLLPVWIFLCLSALLTWTVWLWPISNWIFQIRLAGWRFNFPVTNLKLLIGNILPGLLALIWAGWEGKPELGAILSSLFAWRTKLKWYVLAIALPSGVFLTSMFAVLMLFSEKPRRPHLLVLVNSIWPLPFGPLWEEIAWRAFALRRLQCRYSCLVSALIIGVYWGLWHVPLWVLTATYHTAPFLLIYCVNLIGWSVIFAFFYDRSGQSLPVTILLHSVILPVQNLVFAAVSHGTVYLGPIAAALSLCVAAILARKLGSDRFVSAQPKWEPPQDNTAP